MGRNMPRRECVDAVRKADVIHRTIRRGQGPIDGWPAAHRWTHPSPSPRCRHGLLMIVDPSKQVARAGQAIRMRSQRRRPCSEANASLRFRVLGDLDLRVPGIRSHPGTGPSPPFNSVGNPWRCHDQFSPPCSIRGRPLRRAAPTWAGIPLAPGLNSGPKPKKTPDLHECRPSFSLGGPGHSSSIGGWHGTCEKGFGEGPFPADHPPLP